MPANDLSLLTTTAVNIQRDLKYLPYAVLAAVLGRLGYNLLPGIQNQDVITNYLRKRGIAKPYAQGVVDDSEVGKAQPRILSIELAYASVKDNIQNYKKTIVGPDQLLDKNKTKKHPWEVVMLTSIVRTFGEDIIDALFPAERDIADKSPMGLFNGVDSLIDLDIASGNISVANKNLITLGEIKMPTTETDSVAYDQLLAFWRKADPMLRNNQSIMSVPQDILFAYQTACFNKFRFTPTMDAYNRVTLAGSGDKCKLVGESAMGTGQRIHLQGIGNVDFGMDTLGDEAFVQVRNPYVDPNDVQFWLQASYGVRIRSVHKKVFQINEGLPIANSLSGDYVS